MRLPWFCVLALASLRVSLAQCPVAEFSLPSSVCLGEQVNLNNNSSNSSAFEWFLCDGNYVTGPSAKKILSGFGAVYYSKFVQDGNDHYLFFVSQTQNKLVGLKFTDLSRFEYEVYCQIDLSSVISNPAGLDIINDNGTWIGLITSIVSPFRLVKISLDTDLRSITHSEDLTSQVTLNTPFDVKFLTQDGNYFAFVTNSTGIMSQQVARLAFGASLSNVPTVTYIGFPVASQAASLAFYQTCGDWTAYVSSRNGKVFRILLGADPGTSSPTVAELTLSTALNDPGGLALLQDHDELVLVIQSRNGNTYSGRMSSIADNTVDVVDFGNVKSVNRDWGVEPFRVGGEYKIVSANFTNGGAGGFYELTFPVECPANISYSTQPTETISFGQPGTFKITMRAANESGDSHSLTREIVVSNAIAPEIAAIHPPTNCTGAPVLFDLSSNLDIDSQTWDFGDGSSASTDRSPVHSYAASGDYVVRLNVTASNGCHNTEASRVTIYPPSVADFSLPSTLLCTNNAFTFSTTTSDIYDGNLSYQWYVDDTPVGADRDLQYTFTSTGTKDIKLVTSIPGCESEITKTTSSVEAGPVVDFSFEGVCEDDPFSFHNLTTDPVTGYLWDFANGNKSTTTDAQQVFTDYGDYPVSLTATNAVGCENITTKTVKVHARPVAAFLADGPPNSCSGTPTPLVDQSTTPDGDALTQWLWDFGDTSSDNIQTPTHIFSDAGRYNVSLTVTSAAGCSSNVIQPVDIYQSPSTDFSFSPACDDLPVLFTPPADDSIVAWYWEIGTSYYTASSPTHTFKSPGNYPLYLEVTALNGCESSRHEVIAVPVALTPDFSYLKNCVGEEAVLTDVTTGSDPVKSREWTFDSGETFSGSPVKFVFDKELVKIVTMKVTAASGCSYSVSKSITVLPPPVAGFKPDPSSGAYPLEVAFTNTSSGATHYLWNFNDGTDAVSTDVSPVHSFEGAGSYDVELIASNNQQCSSSFKASIATVAPLPDADIELISLTPNADGSSKLIVTIHNKGNTILRNLPLDLDFGGVLSLREVLANRISPGSKFNFVFSTGIVNPADLQYICVSSDVPNDISPDGNRMCQGLGDALQAFHAYPNPASGSLNIEWVQSGEKNIRLSLVDTMGRIVIDARQTGSDGLNRRALDLSEVESGIYYLVIRQDGIVTTQKIAVSTRP